MTLHGEMLTKPTYLVIQTMKDAGSTAVCKLVEHEIFGRTMVQKTVTLLGIPDAVARSEPRVLDGLRHNHLVEVREAQWDPDYAPVRGVTFTIPYYEGRSIHDALTEGHNFSIGEAVSIVRNVLDALHYLHVQMRLLHRDIKPSNIFLNGARNEGFLGDLGSAAEMSAHGAASAECGTMLYRAPESHTGLYVVTCEIYALGVTMLEMLNGRFIYEDLDFRAVDERVSSGKRALKDSCYIPGPHVPLQLATVLRKMMCPNPTQRYQSAASAQRALEQVRHLNWRQVAASPRRWLGDVVNRRGQRRDYEVVILPLEGRRAGLVEVSARWKIGSATSWRGIGAASGVASPEGESIVRKAFQVSSEHAQKWAAR